MNCNCNCNRYQPAERRTGGSCRCDPPELGLPVAMAYVPWQQWGEVYPADIALCKGTIFPELDLPYKGAPRRRRCING